MKMTQQDYDTLAAAINRVLTGNPHAVAAYRAGNYPRADRCKDVNRRFRWDCLYAARMGDFVSGLYQYLDDTHIDTALKSICPKIEE